MTREPTDADRALVARYLDGTADDQDLAQLGQRLPTDAALVRCLREAARLEVALEGVFAGSRTSASRGSGSGSRSIRAVRRRRRTTSASRPFPTVVALLAAAAIAIAMLGPWSERSSPPSPATPVTAATPTRPVADGVVLTRGAAVDMVAGPAAGAVRVGSRLAPGTRLVVRSGGAALRFTDGTATEVDAGSELEIDWDGRGKRLRLIAGRLRADVAPQPPERPLRVATTHAEMVVVGTSFAVDVDASGTTLRVTSGQVRFTDRADGSVRLVGAGGTAASRVAFRRGINLGGGPVVIDGETWLGLDQALAAGLRLDDWVVRETTEGHVPHPAVDADMHAMLTTLCNSGDRPKRSSWALSQELADGAYTVEVWFMEMNSDHYRSFDLLAEGAVVAEEIGRLPRNAWRRYGPYPVEVDDGRLDLGFRIRGGTPEIMGLRIVGTGAGR